MNRIILPTLLGVVLLIICEFIYAQGSSTQWDYPVKSGTNEWNELKNHREKVNACQIPEHILKSLPTNELIKICLNYPLVTDILAFNNVQGGFNSYKANFNGVNELLNRPDVVNELLVYYSNSNPSDKDLNWANFEQVLFDYKIMVLEFFIAQPEILSKCSPGKTEEIKNLLIKKKKDKLDAGDYEYFSITSTYFPLARIIQAQITSTKSLTKEQNILENFAKNGNLINIEVIPIIDSYTNGTSFVAQSPQGNSVVQTPNGRNVLVTINAEMDDKSRSGYDDIYLYNYKSATLIKTYPSKANPNLYYSSSQRFNCHGFAWHMATRNTFFLDDPVEINGYERSKYWDDSSYIAVAEETYPGKVVWVGGDHSAITTSEPGFFISKCYIFPLMLHRWDDSPYGIKPLKYYVRGKCNETCISNETLRTNQSLICAKVELVNVAINTNVDFQIVYSESLKINGTFQAPLGSTFNFFPASSDGVNPPGANEGCTNPKACNYNPAANIDDGSCLTPNNCLTCNDSNNALFNSDIDGNGSVGIGDAVRMGLVYGKSCTCPEDIDRNGFVGITDLTYISNNYGKSCN